MHESLSRFRSFRIGYLHFLVRSFVYVSVVVACVRLSAATTENILHNFVPLPYGAYPESNLIADSAGNLYGTTYGGGASGYGTVFQVTPDAHGKWKETVLYSFSGGSDGANPAAGLIFDAAGNLYGTTFAGGSTQNDCTYYGCGVVFELSPSGKGGWGESVLHSFDGSDGDQPLAGLVWDQSGNLFGTTSYGSSGSWGVVFELSPNGNGGWTETVLYSFTDGADGANPVASVTLDSSGAVYGTTEYGGDSNCYSDATKETIYGCGTVFQLTKNSDNTWTEKVLHTFLSTDGAYPLSNVILDSAGALYGTTPTGPGICGCGTVFRVAPNSDGSWTHTILYNFEGGPDGSHPYSGLIFGNNGTLYGTTAFGGGSSYCIWSGQQCGTVFQLRQDKGKRWIEKVVYRFSATNLASGSEPVAALLVDRAGNLYGTAEIGGFTAGFCGESYTYGCGTVFRLRPNSDRGWTLDTMVLFAPGREGVGPAGGLISDSSGNLYTTTNGGGTWPCSFPTTGGWGCGTVFELQRQAGGGWKGLTLHEFDGIHDGDGPVGTLIADALGNLYGVTSSGGSADCVNPFAYCGGTAFQLSPTTHGWKETVLYTFTPGGFNGSHPLSGLTIDSRGALYGTTVYGGAGTCRSGCGTVYKLSPGNGGHWKEEILHAFQGGLDGAGPGGTLVVDNNGALYGTACSGGSSGNGNVFRLTQSAESWSEDVLYSFQGYGSGDGSCPLGSFLMDSAGNLYGTTAYGGTGNGTVFELSPSGGSWKETVLWVFQGTDGSTPRSGLAMDGTGNLYVATEQGGANYNCCGTVVELSPGSGGWTEQILHDFSGTPDGSYPNGPVLLDDVGNLYGTALEGGSSGWGMVVALSPGGFENYANQVQPAAPKGDHVKDGQRTGRYRGRLSFLHRFGEGENR